ncbi:hydroxyethylthiazole kinase [Quadrisphaera sp. DSM 44207]|uniref:hydroxyethylthiazole kinase n=1 Tax=Quadrisphaera sp. DSM 44207 TaxID=1881057 RepID=UPI000B822EC2|nr:hydroxyethylthiazole kinase [Quadrisphaera sp. DSM 44207]
MSAIAAPRDPSTLRDDVAAARERLRRDGPLVQCLTNTVVQALTANALLAAGASPAMVDDPHEAAGFAAAASAVLVNVGTVSARTAEAMRLATAAAAEHATPWVLDPVAVGPLPWRTQLAGELLAHRPAVVRGNASEVLALAGSGAGGRGVDSTSSPEEALAGAAALARRTGGAVAVSGAVDVLTDGRRVVRVGGGHVLLTRTTGAGCALGALVAAYAAIVPDRLVAASAASAHVALAAERAAAVCGGPGTFAAAWLDALDAVDGAQLAAADLSAGELAAHESPAGGR